MTREQNFRTSFLSQWSPYSGTQNIESADLKKIPQSFFPAFSLELGKTRYTAFDSGGNATNGEQDFTITTYFTVAQNQIEDTYLDHSDMIHLIEQFINAPVYNPPGLSPGETYILGRTLLVEAKPPVVRNGDTRYSVTVLCKYIFSIL